MLGFITIQPTALDILTFSPVLLPGDHQLVQGQSHCASAFHGLPHLLSG